MARARGWVYGANGSVSGLGSYIYTNVDPTLHSESGFEAPVTPGVQLHDVLAISLNGAGTIDHVVNEEGPAVTPTYQGPAQLVSAPSASVSPSGPRRVAAGAGRLSG
jgi:hypothetical protein